MSAYVVDEALLRYLMTAAVEWGLVSGPDAQVFGQMLLDENVRSVDHRYREVNAREAYEHAASARPVEPLRVLKGLACLSYQSCESPDYEESDARKFCDAILDAAVARLPERLRGFTRDRSGHEVAAYRDEPAYREIGWTRNEFEGVRS